MMTNCHRCGCSCDAYKHETRIGFTFFCTFYCAKFYHDTTGLPIIRSVTGEMVIGESRPLYISEQQAHAISNLSANIFGVSNGKEETYDYNLPSPDRVR
jgi:hypothetical protein